MLNKSGVIKLVIEFLDDFSCKEYFETSINNDTIIIKRRSKRLLDDKNSKLESVLNE